jgi:hypothetical protein
MGPRDVAKHLGGLGACGLEERCCTAYLTDFSPISIKMAKEQGISLTPTEITGICGRLRCCLAYEFDQYTEFRKTLPRKNKRVLTPNGEGKVVEVLPLKGAVLVMLENQVLHEYLAHEIQLFDENGNPLPRITPPVEEEQNEEDKPSLTINFEPIRPTSIDGDVVVSGKPPPSVIQTRSQTHLKGKKSRKDGQQQAHPGPRKQKPPHKDRNRTPQKRSSKPVIPKKTKPSPPPRPMTGTHPLTTEGQHAKRDVPASQRRKRDRQ